MVAVFLDPHRDPHAERIEKDRTDQIGCLCGLLYFILSDDL